MSQTISSEIVLEKLIEKLLQIAIQNTGAQKVILIKEFESQWMIAGQINHGKMSTIKSIPMEGNHNIPSSIIYYVSRTKQNIILNNPVKEGLFSSDPYIVKHKPKSILCMYYPFREDFKGIIYLENNLASGVFTPDRFEVLKLLTTQVTISIDNARMYKIVKELNQSLEKKVEERTKQLKEAEEELRQITENILDMISKTDHEGILRYANPAHTKILGYPLQQLIGTPIFSFVHKDDMKQIQTEFGLMVETNSARHVECRMRHMRGHYIWFEIYGKVVYDDTGNFIGTIICSRDISERKQAEQLRKNIEKQERLLNEVQQYDQLKTEFFANISHELRTPVNVILAAVQMMQLGNDFPMDSHKKYSHIIKQNSYRLVRLVNNLIDITKIDAGYLKLDTKNCNIVNIVEDITLSVVEYASYKQIELLFDTDVEEKIIACDPDKIERIILNLLSNAIKFTDAGGKIVVFLMDQDDKVQISVKDTGIGIPKENQRMIFERFIQVDKSLSRNCEGSGIGLSLVQSLVKMHGGSISIESEYKQGSEFIIELPACVSEAEVQEETACCSWDHNIEGARIEFSDIYF
jgi:PAS domain S-box-containing protein